MCKFLNIAKPAFGVCWKGMALTWPDPAPVNTRLIMFYETIVIINPDMSGLKNPKNGWVPKRSSPATAKGLPSDNLATWRFRDYFPIP
jgi:hypothetical protein